MSQHIRYIKKVTKQSRSKLERDFVKSHSESSLHDLKKPRIDSIRAKELNLNGETKLIKRVYVKSLDSETLDPVGWIANDNIRKCMICYDKFGWFTRKHHCRACGNLVCYVCSGHDVPVSGVEVLGPLRVCVDCVKNREVNNTSTKSVPVYSSTSWGSPVDISTFRQNPRKPLNITPRTEESSVGSTIVVQRNNSGTVLAATDNDSHNTVSNAEHPNGHEAASNMDHHNSAEHTRDRSFTQQSGTNPHQNTHTTAENAVTNNGDGKTNLPPKSPTQPKSPQTNIKQPPPKRRSLRQQKTDQAFEEITVDMMKVQPHLIVTNEVAQLTKVDSAKYPKTLLGWQIALHATSITPEIVHKEIYVVVDTRKTLARKTEFRLCALKTIKPGGKPWSVNTDEHIEKLSMWTLLKRNDNKAGLDFVPLQHVLYKTVDYTAVQVPSPTNKDSAKSNNNMHKENQNSHSSNDMHQQNTDSGGNDVNGADDAGEDDDDDADRDSGEFDIERPSIMDRASMHSIYPEFDHFEFPDLTEEESAQFEDKRHNNSFQVRGPGYNKDKKKIAGGSAMCKLMLVEVYEVDCTPGRVDADLRRHDHIASRGLAKGRVEAIANLPGNPFQFIVNIQIPGDPPISIVLFFAVPPDLFDTPEDGMADLTHFKQLMERFIMMPDSESERLKEWGVDAVSRSSSSSEPAPPQRASFAMKMPSDVSWPTPQEPGAFPRNDFKNSRFKLVPTITEGPWVVKSAVGSKPTLLGKKIVCRYFSGLCEKRGDKNREQSSPTKSIFGFGNSSSPVKEKSSSEQKSTLGGGKSSYMEIDMHIGSSSIASQIVGVCRGAAKHFIADLAFIIEAEGSDELPEKLLGVAALCNIDLSVRKKLE